MIPNGCSHLVFYGCNYPLVPYLLDMWKQSFLLQCRSFTILQYLKYIPYTHVIIFFFFSRIHENILFKQRKPILWSWRKGKKKRKKYHDYHPKSINRCGASNATSLLVIMIIWYSDQCDYVKSFSIWVIYWACSQSVQWISKRPNSRLWIGNYTSFPSSSFR